MPMQAPMNQGFARDLSVVMNKNVLMNAYNKKADMVTLSSFRS